MGYEIIIAGEHHLPKVFELWKKLQKMHKDLAPLLYGNISEDHGLTYLRELISSNHEMIFVCLIDGKVEGFITASIYRKHPLYGAILYCYILDMLVRENYRQQGIGIALVKEVLDCARFFDVERVELGVAHPNDQVFHFYKCLGFQDYSRQFTLDLS